MWLEIRGDRDCLVGRGFYPVRVGFYLRFLDCVRRVLAAGWRAEVEKNGGQRRWLDRLRGCDLD